MVWSLGNLILFRNWWRVGLICGFSYFGVAPSILAYSASLKDLQSIGMICALAYSICGMLRLARFNKQSKLPTLLACRFHLRQCVSHFMFLKNPVSVAFGTCVLAYLMVSKIKFPHFKRYS